jgi:hypothetical protein
VKEKVVPVIPEEEKQYFYRTIILQLAVVPNANVPKSLVEKHYGLCKEALRIYNHIANECGSELSESTWDTLLRVNIEIAHNYLSEAESQNESVKQIEQMLIDGIFEYWLRSGIQSLKLFTYFSYHAINWLHRKNVLKVWRNVCIALAKRLSIAMYGANLSNAGELVEINKTPLDLCGNFMKNQSKYTIVKAVTQDIAKIFNVPDELLVYYWMEFMFLFDKRLKNVEESLVEFSNPKEFYLYIEYFTEILRVFSVTAHYNSNSEIRYSGEEIKKAANSAPFPIQDKEFGAKIKSLFIELTEKRKRDKLPQVVPNGDTLIRLFGTVFFEIIQKKGDLVEYEKAFYSEFCRLLTNYPGPFSPTLTAWLYFRLEDFLTKDETAIGENYNFIINSSKLFINDIYGMRILVPAFGEYIQKLLNKNNMETKGQSEKSDYNRTLVNALKILSQISASCNTFISTEAVTTLKDNGNKEALNHMIQYQTTQKSVTRFLESKIKDLPFTKLNLCAYLWVTAIDVLQSKKQVDYLSFISSVISKLPVIEEPNVQDKLVEVNGIGQAQVFFTLLDIVEMLIMRMGSDMDISTTLNKLMTQLLDFAEKKLPTESTSPQAKALMASNKYNERIPQRIIQLIMIILNTLPTTDNSLIITKLHKMLYNLKRIHENDKSLSIDTYNLLKYAVNWLIVNNRRHRITNYFPNVDTVFGLSELSCLYDPLVPKSYLLVLDSCCMMTVFELKKEKEKYDIVVAIRNEFGQYAFRAQMIIDLRQFNKDLVNYYVENEIVKTDKYKVSENTSNGIKLIRDDLISNKPISNIKMTAEKAEEHKSFEDFLRAEAKKEKESVKDQEEGLGKIGIEYEKVQVNCSENTLARLFFNHFQLINENNLSSTFTLKETKELIEDLKLLDNKPKVLLQTIPLLYYKSATSDLHEINYNEDKNFNEVVKELGLVLDQSHISTGNFNHIRELLESVAVVYNKKLFYEQVFIVPSLRLNSRTVVSLLI